MHARVQIASIAFAFVLFVGVFELVRRGRLRERYALLWLAAGLVLLVLAAWQHLLSVVSKAVGIYYPPNAFFVIAFGFVLLLLLHFSTSVSRLSDQTRVLAQRLALLEQRITRAELRSLNAEVPDDLESAADGESLDRPRNRAETRR